MSDTPDSTSDTGRLDPGELFPQGGTFTSITTGVKAAGLKAAGVNLDRDRFNPTKASASGYGIKGV